MKTDKWTLTVLLALAFTLSTSTIMMLVEADRVGFALSDYETGITKQVTMKVGDVEWYPIARLYNSGDFNITVTCTWIADDELSGVRVELVPNTVLLTPEGTVNDQALIEARVTAKEAGNWSGEADFHCDVEYPESFSGSKSTPGGSATACFIVISESPAHAGFNWTPIIIGIAAFGGVLTFGFYMVKRRSKEG